jgi:hypothetical protein
LVFFLLLVRLLASLALMVVEAGDLLGLDQAPVM